MVEEIGDRLATLFDEARTTWLVKTFLGILGAVWVGPKPRRKEPTVVCWRPAFLNSVNRKIIMIRKRQGNQLKNLFFYDR